jgi:phosphoenolpyruvate-protein phosphotransferase (PTS system enzyme I)
MSNSPDTLKLPGATRTAQILHGIGGSPGVAVAPAMIVRSRVMDVPERTINPDESEAEWCRFEKARDQTREQLQHLRSRLHARAKNGEAGILDAHLMVLDDEVMSAHVRRELFENHHNAEWAVRDVANVFIKQFLQLEDSYLKERADDISDVGRRMIRNLLGISEELPERWDGPCIIVAENLTPSETIALPRDKVQGFALDRGSMTSHAALIARALEIPAVFGLGRIATLAKQGDTLGIDGARGVVILNPSPRDLKRLNGLAVARADAQRELTHLRDLPAVTPDGRRIPLYANIENVNEMGTVDAHGAEGVGLFRTEYLWLASGRAVGEAQQTAVYTTAVRAMRGRPLVIRAFDLGGDKFISNVGLSQEANPFLGMRSIRYLLRHPEVFKAQLRAMLRAHAEGDVRILLPMISDVVELRRSHEILDDCFHDVTTEGLVCPPVKVGAMIEIPSAALAADLLAEQVDFFSIGTNDLTQYTLAVDRINEHVAHLYQPTHPAVMRLIALTVDAARRHQIPVSVCGEMASDPLTALLLVGMGIEELSMAPSSIPVVKDAIRKTTLEQAQELAAKAAMAGSASEILKYCRDLLVKVAPELLPLV